VGAYTVYPLAHLNAVLHGPVRDALEQEARCSTALPMDTGCHDIERTTKSRNNIKENEGAEDTDESQARYRVLERIRDRGVHIRRLVRVRNLPLFPALQSRALAGLEYKDHYLL
jgi:hypothetical protein